MTILNIPIPPPAKQDVHTDAGIRTQITAIFELHSKSSGSTRPTRNACSRSLAFAGTHPRITDGQPLTLREIVAILLDGISRRPDPE